MVELPDARDIVGDELYVLSNTSRVFSFHIHEKVKKAEKKLIKGVE